MKHEAMERLAIALHHRAGLDPEHLNCPVLVAKRCGVRVLDSGDTPMPGDGFCLSPASGGALIFVNAQLPRRRLAFAVAHELAEVELTRLGYEGADREAAADRLGAAILLPRPAVAAVLRSRPWRGVRHFASLLDVNSTCAALRLGEVTLDPVAVVGRDRIVVRGVDQWPESPARLAKCRALPEGIYRVQVERGRVVVAATG